MANQKGLPVDVYRNGTRTGDTTLGGVSSQCNELLLVGEGVTELSEAHGRPVVKLVRKTVFGNPYIHAQPLEGSGYMFGGNFIYTSDSRFPSAYPIPIHDRRER